LRNLRSCSRFLSCGAQRRPQQTGAEQGKQEGNTTRVPADVDAWMHRRRHRHDDVRPHKNAPANMPQKSTRRVCVSYTGVDSKSWREIYQSLILRCSVDFHLDFLPRYCGSPCSLLHRFVKRGTDQGWHKSITSH
jgi:hypothetical protein